MLYSSVIARNRQMFGLAAILVGIATCAAAQQMKASTKAVSSDSRSVEVPLILDSLLFTDQALNNELTAKISATLTGKRIFARDPHKHWALRGGQGINRETARNSRTREARTVIVLRLLSCRRSKAAKLRTTKQRSDC